MTFITAVQYLDTHSLPFGGHMAAAMALMESPAIIMAVLLANRARRRQAVTAEVASPGPLSKVLHEALTDGAQLLLIGAMLIGILSGESGKAALQPFAGDLFKGLLAFFLLDMGLLAARKMAGLRGQRPLLIAYAFGAPLLHASVALGLSVRCGLAQGNAALLMVLAASASYIAVPAVVRHAIPEANPSLYVGMSLGLTFPLHILLGVPLYVSLAQWAIGS